MISRVTRMPFLACQTNELTTYNPEAGEWQCALPNSTPHYLADQRRWVLCPADWVLTRNVITGRHWWTAPQTSPP